VRVATSPERLEAIANSPRVRPYLGGEGRIAAGDTWGRTLALEWPDGGVVFMAEGDDVFDAHLVFDRGAHDTLHKCREALQHLFTRTRARKVTGNFPTNFRHVRRLVTALGMRHVKDEDGRAHYALTAREWITGRSG
jgi:hypothetical protein